MRDSVAICSLCAAVLTWSSRSTRSEHLNGDFVQFLLDVVEDGHPSDPTEQLPDLFLNLLLAFNLHHTGDHRQRAHFVRINIDNWGSAFYWPRNCSSSEWNQIQIPLEDRTARNSVFTPLGSLSAYISLTHFPACLCHAAPSNNAIMQQLREKNVKVLTEKVLLLLNRGGTRLFYWRPSCCLTHHTTSLYIHSSADDPVCMFKHMPPAPHAVLKFLQDVFASQETADIFYRTDMMVMIDIAVRQISDLSPGDKVSWGDINSCIKSL